MDGAVQKIRRQLVTMVGRPVGAWRARPGQARQGRAGQGRAGQGRVGSGLCCKVPTGGEGPQGLRVRTSG